MSTLGAFVSPRQIDEYEVEGVKFKIRTLTAQERLPMVVQVGKSYSDSGDANAFTPENLLHALRCGLVGWDVEEPKWNSENMEANIEVLSDKAVMAIAAEIINRSFMTGDDAGN